MPHSVSFDLVLYCLPLAQKKDSGLNGNFYTNIGKCADNRHDT